MLSPSANFRRQFLPWDRPLLPQAVAWLAAEWSGGEPLDLSGVLVVVPTRQSGRRLREALAAHAAGRGQAAFAPRVVTPEVLVTETLAGRGLASRLESLLAWMEVLRELAPGEFDAVFPVEPPARNAAWAMRLAQTLVRVQATLAEAGLRLRDVVAKAGEDFPEVGRWRQFGELEARFDAQLARRGLQDEQAAKISAAQSPLLPAEVTKIVVLAAPDPLPLAVQILAERAREVPVAVLVFAPEAAADAFDAWGRPVPEKWERRELSLPDFAHRVHLCADPAAQADLLAASAARYRQPDGLLALGLTDPEVMAPLEAELARVDIVAFNPEGRAQRDEALYPLLEALGALAHEPTFDTVASLARCPDFLAYLARRQGKAFSAAAFLATLDELQCDHLPADLAAARKHATGPLAAALHLMDELRAALLTDAFPDNAAAALSTLFAGRQLDPARPADARFEESARQWMQVVRSCATARERFPGLGDAEWWELALALFGEIQDRSETKPAGALELQGILELLFEDAPHLAVAGCNDGRLPEGVIVGDPFLPESLRAKLGLKSNAARFARDAYIIQAAAASRPRLDLLFGRTSAAGDPLRPSRLLLCCPDAELPVRVAQLFREPPSVRPTPPWARAWRLTPPRRPPPDRVSVTALRAWLDCPFRFYLRHVLDLEAVDLFKSELDAFDFGIVVHRALEALGREETLAGCTDVGILRTFLLAEFERAARQRFGAELSLPLVIQLESARQRLAKAAEIEAGQRAEGWRTVAVEKKITFAIAGLPIVGKIDRIDRHTETGAVRVLDYKTSDQAVTPAAAHIRSLRRGETPPPWASVPGEKKPRVWRDLQLPLYEHALAAEFGPGAACGYFNLPKAVSDTRIELWDGLTPDLRESARRCAGGVCTAIRGGVFWPPRELTGRDAESDGFAPLFHGGAAASIASEEPRP